MKFLFISLILYIVLLSFVMYWEVNRTPPQANVWQWYGSSNTEPTFSNPDIGRY